MTQAATRGFTLIELLVALVIAAFLVMLALPNYHRWIADAQTANAASMVADGLRSAQAEAIKRNTNVEFTLATGVGWSVQEPSGSAIKVSTLPEGSKYAVLTPNPPGNGTVTFNSFGLIVPNATAPVAPFTSIEVTTAAGSRTLWVMVGGAGASAQGIRVCQYLPALPVGDPAKCP